MSHPESARRSASHGALHTSYDAHGRHMDAGNDLSLPPFRPLKSLRENTAFLQSPGPLESMLKTTTETGDIGIFSIRPMKSSSTLPHEPRPRPSLKDMRSASRCSRASTRTSGQDDRRRLPSYRDSTSEILSMYGGSNRSVSSSLYPGFDANGQRSYSMVSSISRYLPVSQAERPSRGHPYPNGLQRPRSPFPYPTRLKRPGVRPASPALTENGSVDYSRMVEIDRISLVGFITCFGSDWPLMPMKRTIHGSYRPLPRQKPRRPLPLALRADLNQSTPSYSGHPRRQSPTASNLRIGSSDHGHSRGDYIFKERPDNSSNYNRRLPSLTSTIDGYAGPSLHGDGPTSTKKAFYYDYSEEFEGQEEQVPHSMTPDAPLAPVPTRIPSSHRPMVLRDDYEDQLDDRRDGDQLGITGYCRPRAVSESSQDASVHGLAECLELEETLKPKPIRQHEHSRGVDKFDAPDFVDGTATPGNVPVISIASPRTSGLNLQGILDDNTMKIEGTKNDQGLDKGSTEQSNVTTTNSYAPEALRSAKLRAANRNGLGKFPGTLNHMETSSPIPASRRPDETERQTPASTLELTDLSPETESKEGSKTAHRRGYMPDFPSRPLKRQHRRNHSAHKPLDTHNLDYMNGSVDTPRDCSKSPMIAPEPLSPARLLRVKDSIPQLMKALPPLPGYSPAPESPFGAAVVPVNFEPFELSRLTEARSTLTDAILPENRAVGNTNNYHAFVFDQNIAKKRPKLRLSPATAEEALRNVEPDEPGESGPSLRYRGTKQGISADGHPDRRTPIKARLKLKISRGALSTKSADYVGTVKRHHRADRSEALSGLELSRPTDLFTSASGLDSLYRSRRGGKETRAEKSETQSKKGPSISGHTSPPRLPPIVFENHRGSSLDAYVNNARLSRVRKESLNFSEVRSVLSEGSKAMPRKGLRRGLSNFRARFAEPRNHNTHKDLLSNDRSKDLEMKNCPADVPSPFISMGTKGTLLGSSDTIDPAAKNFAKTKRLKRKLERWLRDARDAVTAVVRKGSRRGQ